MKGEPELCSACGEVATLNRCWCGAPLCGSYNPTCVGREVGCPACNYVITDDEEKLERAKRRSDETHEQWVLRRSCLDKTAWSRGSTAAKAAFALNQRLPAGAARFYYYDCGHCRRFHLTRQSPQEQAERRVRARKAEGA